MFPFLFKAGRMFGRGDFRYLVLNTLKEKPMHGYEIMKVVGDRFSGFYSPCWKRKGAIYIKWI